MSQRCPCSRVLHRMWPAWTSEPCGGGSACVGWSKEGAWDLRKAHHEWVGWLGSLLCKGGEQLSPRCMSLTRVVGTIWKPPCAVRRQCSVEFEPEIGERAEA